MARPRTPPVINPQAYAPTVWQDGVTPVNAANLNKLEQGLAAAVGIPADVVVTPATALLIRNRLNAADTQPAFRLGADGRVFEVKADQMGIERCDGTGPDDSFFVVALFDPRRSHA